MKKDNVITLDIRRQIYDFISKQPGMHFREISRELDMPHSSLKYHLNYLEKRRLVVSKNNGRYLRYYTVEKVGHNEKEVFNLLRNDTTMKIVIIFFSNFVTSRIELSEYLEKNPTTIEFHLRKLIDLDLIESATTEDGEIIRRQDKAVIVRKKPVGNEIIYRWKRNPQEIYDILIKNKKILTNDETIYTLIDTMEYMLTEWWHGEVPKRINGRTYAIENVLETFYDIFPHPYHV